MNGLENRLIEEYGLNYFNKIKEGYGVHRYLTLRVNNLKTSKDFVVSVLDENHIVYESVAWYEMAFVILNDDKKKIESLDIYLKGEIYFQSLSSMLPPLFMDLKKGEQVLDMAAAPGGKTSLMQALTSNTLMITAIEKNTVRAERLKYNLDKQGVKKVTVLKCDARYIDDYFLFDKILLDAPCSGSGTLNLNEFEEFSCDALFSYAKRQKELLLSAVKHVRSGGLIVYSTCSILKEENEDVVRYVLEKCKDLELLPVGKLDGFNGKVLPSELDGVMTILPSKYYEGFFVSVLRKK